jgi:signal transduction histidine kinase/CheY-like chemotaxis protein
VFAADRVMADRRVEAGINDLRAENYTSAAITVSAGAFLAMAAFFPRSPEYILIWPFFIAGAALLGHAVLGRSVKLASLSLVSGVFVAETAAIWAFPNTPLAVLYAPIVLLASELLGPRASAIVAVLASACVIAARGPDIQVLSAETELISLALICTTGVFSWLTTRSLYTTLDWSWYNYVQAETTVEELRQRQGDLVRALKDLNDATYGLERANAELERARSAAQEAYRLKAEFASTVSHELRTPLNLIIGFSEMMATAPHTYSGQALPPEYQCDIESIYRNARHLSNLVDDILDLSQIDAGRMALNREPVDLATVTSEAARAVGGLLEAKHLRLIVEVAGNLPRLLVDPTRIRQVMINLLSNAARFTEQGYIAVRAWHDDGRVVVAVKDTGIGIAAEDLPKMFDPFRQADGSIRRRFGGNGLGLTIAKEIIELHGGNIWVESEVEEGSTFCFSLPLVENVVSALLRREWETWARVSPGAGLVRDTVAVVDQDQEGRGFRIIRRYLDDWTVVWARSVTELKRVSGQVPLQAVIVTASREDAPTLYSPAWLPKGVPVISCPLTGPSVLKSELNVVEYMTKPVVVEQIATVLKQFRHVRSVLIVDDDPETVRMLGRMVRSILRRARVVGAYNGADAVVALERMRPDVVFLDLLMPDVDGYALLRHIRDHPQLLDIPVVVVTAAGKHSEEMMARSLTLTCQRAFGIGELVDVLKANLATLKRQTESSDPKPQAALVD